MGRPPGKTLVEIINKINARQAGFNQTLDMIDYRIRKIEKKLGMKEGYG